MAAKSPHPHALALTLLLETIGTLTSIDGGGIKALRQLRSLVNGSIGRLNKPQE
jgi:hypothetical protein